MMHFQAGQMGAAPSSRPPSPTMLCLTSFRPLHVNPQPCRCAVSWQGLSWPQQAQQPLERELSLY